MSDAFLLTSQSLVLHWAAAVLELLDFSYVADLDLLRTFLRSFALHLSTITSFEHHLDLRDRLPVWRSKLDSWSDLIQASMHLKN